MPEPILKEISNLSIWDLSHYWHGCNPQKSTTSRLPLEVQKTIRALSLKASKGLYLRCVHNSFIHKALTDPDDNFSLTYVKRVYQREFKFAIEGRKYKRTFLTKISMSRKGILIWCKQNKIQPPAFWFAADDPLVSKSVEELQSPLSVDQMKKYGYVPLFNEDAINSELVHTEHFSSDIELNQDKPNFKPKRSPIDEAISEINKANAKVRYLPLDKLKQEFKNFHLSNGDKNKSKSARDYFNSLSVENRKVIVRSYYEKDHDNFLKNAVRNLTKVLKG